VARAEALPSEELSRRQETLRPLARQEAAEQRRHKELREHIETEADFLSGMDAQHRRASGLPRRSRRRELERIDATEARAETALARLRAEAAALPPISDTARRELAALEEVLRGRVELAVTAARLAPPPYVVKELGERPTDPTGAEVWDRGLRAIESYRQRNGVKDQAHPFGAEPKDPAARERRELEMGQMRHLQRQLREQELRRAGERSAERGMGIGL
jgi:hypothetical protein